MPFLYESLPTADEINKEYLFCKQLAIPTATKLGLIEITNSVDEKCMCKINPLVFQNQTNEFQKRQVVPSVDSKSNAFEFKLADLENIELKNFDGKYKASDMSEAGPYVEIVCADDKKILVKKTSLCWLLGTDCVKLSDDRLLRVRAATTITSTVKNRYLIYPQKRKRMNGERK